MHAGIVRTKLQGDSNNISLNQRRQGSLTKLKRLRGPDALAEGPELDFTVQSLTRGWRDQQRRRAT